VIQPSGIPAIVPQDLFDRVQARLEKNKKAPARFKAKEELYLLSLKLYCGLCGALMIGESGTSHTGKIHQYYKCSTAKHKKSCPKKTVQKSRIEDLVVTETMKMLTDDAVVEYIADLVMELQERENTDLPRYKAQLAETETSIDNMLNAIQQGIFNSSTKQRLDALEAAKGELEVKILQEEMQRPLLTREQVVFWICRYRQLDVTIPEQRQRLIDGFVNSVYLYDDKIILTFNYKEGCKTISLRDIMGLANSSDLCARVAPGRKRPP